MVVGVATVRVANRKRWLLWKKGSLKMSEIVSLRGPVELFRGQLTLRIPLEAGGDRFVHCTRGIGEVDGEYLNIVIKPWLAERLGVCHGSLVSVDNRDGKFNITLAEPEGDAIT